jgi:hypothetical protein
MTSTELGINQIELPIPISHNTRLVLTVSDGFAQLIGSKGKKVVAPNDASGFTEVAVPVANRACRVHQTAR